MISTMRLAREVQVGGVTSMLIVHLWHLLMSKCSVMLLFYASKVTIKESISC